jgi:hypothetical protein
LLICNIAGAGGCADSWLRRVGGFCDASPGVSPISPKAYSPKAALVYRNAIMSLPPYMDDVHCCKSN